MDQNHAPPSPLQQHRPSSSRHGNQGSSNTPASTMDNKLKNPVGLHRQGTTCTSPTSTQTNLTPWSGAQEPSSSSSGSTSTTMSWSQDNEETAVERWRAQAQSSSSTSTASSSTWNNTNTQPLASSSRCPSPHHIPMDITSSATESHSPQPYHQDVSSSSLLTSEPLNRTTSANPSPTMHTPEPLPRRKRNRACSLPNATPVFKRRKSKHDTPTPSEVWQRTYETGRTSPTKIQRQKAAAAELGRVLRSNRQIKSVSSQQDQHCIVACRQPAINVNSLRTLDATEILKNPQLRHDLLFDSLAFRPVNLPYEVPTKPGYAEIVTGGKTPVVDPRQSSFVADMYWDSISEELETGCRCVRWKMPKNQIKLNNRLVEKLERIPQCLCGRWRRDLTENEWWSRAAVWPSRLPELIKTLREILVSLMGSTTPCPNHFAHSFSKEALEAHEAVCPTVTHALVPELYAALDPEFLTIQARRGVFDLHLFEKLGEAMKVHCAPVRDEMVDDMVRTALSGDVAKGLRKCFDCAEVMKLDIANHQVHALRPYLWENANQYEYNAFHSLLVQSKVTPESSKTRQWINSASRQVLSAAEPKLRTHLIGRCDCKNSMELVIRSLTTGFMDLVFDQWDSEIGTWPPAVQRRSMGSNGIPVLEGPIKGAVEIPESFKMDSRRIKDFHSEVVDIAISHMVLLAFRNLFSQHNGKVTSDISQSNLNKARMDIEWTMDKLSTMYQSPEEPNWDTQTSFNERNLKSDLAFRLALRIVRPEASISSSTLPTQEEMKLVSSYASTLTEYLNVNLSKDSELLKGNMLRLKTVLNKILSDVLLGYRLNPTSTFFDSNVNKCFKRNNSISTCTSNLSISTSETDNEDSVSTEKEVKSYPREIREKYESFVSKSKQEELNLIKSFGLEGVIEPIKELTDRMIKIVAFNLSVFGETYASQGMMVGSDRRG